MRYLTREWHSSEVAADAENEISEAHRAYRVSVLPKLLPNFREFAETIDIHDALIREIRLNRQSGTLEIDLRSGDLRAGYLDLELHYSGIDLQTLDTSVLASIGRDAQAEALYHEVDVASGGLYEHRWLWWPYQDLNIRFRGFAFVVEPQPDRAFERPADACVEIGSPAV